MNIPIYRAGLNIWLVIRMAVILLGAFGAHSFVPSAHSPFVGGSSELLLAFFCFGLFATILVVGVQAINPRSAPVWTVPDWHVNPFSLTQPLQFFHLMSFHFIACGACAAALALSRHTEGVDPLLPIALGIGTLSGVRCSIGPLSQEVRFQVMSSEDLACCSQDTNIYSYVNNNPLTQIDPTGFVNKYYSFSPGGGEGSGGFLSGGSYDPTTGITTFSLGGSSSGGSSGYDPSSLCYVCNSSTLGTANNIIAFASSDGSTGAGPPVQGQTAQGSNSDDSLDYIQTTATKLSFDPATETVGPAGIGGGYLSPGPTQDQLDRIDTAIDQMQAAQKAMNDALSANPRTRNDPYYSIEYNVALGDLARANAQYDKAMYAISSGTSTSTNP